MPGKRYRGAGDAGGDRAMPEAGGLGEDENAERGGAGRRWYGDDAAHHEDRTQHSAEPRSQ